MNYNLHYIVRITILVLVSVLIGYVLNEEGFFFTPMVLVGVLMALGIELWAFIRTGNQKMERVLFALRHQDAASGLGKQWKGAHLESLEAELNALLNTLRSKGMQEDEERDLLLLVFGKLPFAMVLAHAEQIHLNDAGQALLGWNEVVSLKRWKERFKSIDPFDQKPKIDRIVEINGQRYDVAIRAFLASGRYSVMVMREAGSSGDDQEVEAWLKLIRIMTHEIMNSVTSITSLSETVKLRLQDHPDKDLITAVTAIGKRAEGLVRFVDDYRKMSHVPAPKMIWFDVEEMINETVEEFQFDGSITRSLVDVQSKQVYGDALQMKHVLSNLMLNAVQAMKETENPQLTLRLVDQDGRIRLRVEDNGSGVESSTANDMFIPFFSTKDEGSGIGLSLSRQMMRNQGGALSYEDNPAGGAIFTIHFPMPS